MDPTNPTATQVPVCIRGISRKESCFGLPKVNLSMELLRVACRLTIFHLDHSLATEF